MRQRQTVTAALPLLWLISDARNDDGLERALAALPRGSGFIYRHYHLPNDKRRTRFVQLARLARQYGHCVILAGTAREARCWGADGAYGSTGRLGAPVARAGRRAKALRLVTVHNFTEIARAHAACADAFLLSPVFATRSHPGQSGLGPLRFRRLAAHARVPVIALGGMTQNRAKRLNTVHWAAIDGLVHPA